jgi:hypothetical protein
MAYDGRRAPNVSEFVSQLNAIPTAQDLQNAENFNLDEDLSMFTDTQFFDFDLGQAADLRPFDFDVSGHPAAADNGDLKPLDSSAQGMCG